MSWNGTLHRHGYPGEVDCEVEDAGSLWFRLYLGGKRTLWNPATQIELRFGSVTGLADALGPTMRRVSP